MEDRYPKDSGYRCATCGEPIVVRNARQMRRRQRHAEEGRPNFCSLGCGGGASNNHCISGISAPNWGHFDVAP